MRNKKNEEVWQRIINGEHGYAVANVARADVSWVKGDSVFGTYYGPGNQIVGEELNDAMILSIAMHKKLRFNKEVGRASKRAFYEADISRMIRQRRRWDTDFKDKHKEADKLEEYWENNRDIFI